MEWSDDVLVASWTLVGEDWSLVGSKTGATRLGFAVLLKFFEVEARFPRSAEEVALQAVTYLAEQLKVDATVSTGYAWSGRIKYHRGQIRAAFGFGGFTRLCPSSPITLNFGGSAAANAAAARDSWQVLLKFLGAHLPRWTPESDQSSSGSAGDRHR